MPPSTGSARRRYGAAPASVSKAGIGVLRVEMPPPFVPAYQRVVVVGSGIVARRSEPATLKVSRTGSVRATSA